MVEKMTRTELLNLIELYADALVKEDKNTADDYYTKIQSALDVQFIDADNPEVIVVDTKSDLKDFSINTAQQSIYWSDGKIRI
jgi:hypothetical protein